jgi:hypothetical protein
MYYESFGMIADGKEEIAHAVRLCCREEVDNIKINISGDDLGPLVHGGLTVMEEEEVAMAVKPRRSATRQLPCPFGGICEARSALRRRRHPP